MRVEVQEIMKSHPAVLTVDNACEVDTQSEIEKGAGESSDAMKLKQLRDQMV